MHRLICCTGKTGEKSMDVGNVASIHQWTMTKLMDIYDREVCASSADLLENVVICFCTLLHRMKSINQCIDLVRWNSLSCVWMN